MFLHDINGKEIMYWRKSNHIHNWFINNVNNAILNNDGTDYKVTEEQLLDLIFTIKKVLNSTALAEEILPTASGFFWGSQDYDKYYFEDLKETLKALENELKGNDGVDYYYSSSC